MRSDVCVGADWVLELTHQTHHSTTNFKGITLNATLNRRLGVAGIVFMVIAAAAPITVVAANFPIIFSVSGSVGAPTMILVATIILLLFSVGYAWMTPQVPDAGAFY